MAILADVGWEMIKYILWRGDVEGEGGCEGEGWIAELQVPLQPQGAGNIGSLFVKDVGRDKYTTEVLKLKT